jgi:hypothetical protein
MIFIRRMVLDVLKPISPSLMELAARLCAIRGVTSAECTIMEIDRETESAKVILEGNNIDFAVVENVIASFGAAVHSVDSVTASKKIEKHKPHASHAAKERNASG